MGHVSYMHESFDKYGGVMWHVWNTWISACHTYERGTTRCGSCGLKMELWGSSSWHVLRSHVKRMNEPCETYALVACHVCMGHVTRMTESRDTYETHEWAHVTSMRKSYVPEVAGWGRNYESRVRGLADVCSVLQRVLQCSSVSLLQCWILTWYLKTELWGSSPWIRKCMWCVAVCVAVLQCCSIAVLQC